MQLFWIHLDEIYHNNIKNFTYNAKFKKILVSKGYFGQIIEGSRHKKGHKSGNIGPRRLGNTVFYRIKIAKLNMRYLVCASCDPSGKFDMVCLKNALKNPIGSLSFNDPFS